jgi:hypothetical protein
VTGPVPQVPVPAGRPRSHAHLQALDDAIRYRAARLRRPCRRCRPAQPCNDHACDLNLLTAYHEMASTAVAALRARQPAPGPQDGPGSPEPAEPG